MSIKEGEGSSKKKKFTQRQIQEKVMARIFNDKITGNPKTHKIRIQSLTNLKPQQVASALQELRKKGLIEKPEGATERDGFWTITEANLLRFRKRFLKRKRYKQRYCSLLFFDRDLGSRRCLITGNIITCPQLHCDVLHTTVVEDGKKTKSTVPMCAGYTLQKPTEDIVSLARFRFLEEEAKDIGNIRYHSRNQLDPESKFHLPRLVTFNESLMLPNGTYGSVTASIEVLPYALTEESRNS